MSAATPKQGRTRRSKQDPALYSAVERGSEGGEDEEDEEEGEHSANSSRNLSNSHPPPPEGWEPFSEQRSPLYGPPRASKLRAEINELHKILEEKASLVSTLEKERDEAREEAKER